MYTISINNGLSECTPEDALEALPMDVIVNAMDDTLREQVHNAMTADTTDAEFIRRYLELAPIVIG